MTTARAADCKLYDASGRAIELKEVARVSTSGKILAFLLALEDAIEPPEGRHHNLAAMEDRLVLSVSRGERWDTFFLDDQDLDRPCKELVSEIVGLLK